MSTQQLAQNTPEQSLALRPERAPVRSGNRGLELTDMDSMFRFAKAVSASPFAPKGIESPEAIFVAVQMGMEIGLTPMAALQNIAVINGRPGIYGDAALALVRASGLMETYSQEIEGDGDNRVAVVTSKRAGQSPIRSTFSVTDAKKASLWGKQGPWSQYPERMLTFRARGFNLRDNFGDVLKGLRTTEELMDTEENRATIARPVIGHTVEPSEHRQAALPEGEKPPVAEKEKTATPASTTTEPTKRGPGRPPGKKLPVAEKPPEPAATEPPAGDQSGSEPATIAEKVEARLRADGFTNAELMRVAIQNRWCEPCDAEKTPLSSLGETVLESFLEDWITVASEIENLRELAAKKGEK